MLIDNLNVIANCVVVLDAAKMNRDKINVYEFTQNRSHAVFSSDSARINLDYSKTTIVAREESWIKAYGKYIIFEESSIGIEQFHEITNSFELFFCNLTIMNTNKFTKTVKELKTIDSKLFTSSSYEDFIQVNRNSISINQSYKGNCYSKNLFKSIYINNKNIISDNTIFTFFEIKSDEYGFKVTFDDKSEKIYDYSTKPPGGKGGPLFVGIIEKLDLYNLMATALQK